MSTKGLTPEQEAKIPAYQAKWSAVSDSTEPCDFERAKGFVKLAYEQAGFTPPTFMFLFKGPVQQACASIILRDIIDSRIKTGRFRYTTGAEYTQSLSNFLQGALDALKPQVFEQMSNFDMVIKGKKQHFEINWEVEWPELEKSIRRMYLQEKGKFTSEYESGIRDQLFGCHDAHWLCFHDFFKHECGYDLKDVSGLNGIAETTGWWACYEDAALLQDRVAEYHTREGRLHKDGGPALRFRDGLEVWMLNGVQFEDQYTWIIQRPEGQFSKEDCQNILKIENVEVRQEAIRKVGADLLCFRLEPEVLDSEPADPENPGSGYRLLRLDIGREDRKKACILHMINPSVEGAEHYEWVDADCKTVQDAINFRCGFDPKQIRSPGDRGYNTAEEWWQQGDVIILQKSDKPMAQRRFRNRPSRLT